MSLDIIPAARISASGLDAERSRMELIANNIANVHATRGSDGEVYRKQIPVFRTVLNESAKSATGKLGGVELEEVVDDARKPIEMYAPYHPDADKNGMIQVPNMSPIEEMMDMITATRAYEANLTVMKESRKMADQTISLLK